MKNLSKYKAQQLAEIHAEDFCAELIDENESLAFWNAGVRLVGIFPLALCAADYESISEPLSGYLEDGDLDKTFDGNRVDAEFLMKKGGALVVVNFQMHDFSDTTFDKAGHMDSCHSSGWGYYSTDFLWTKNIIPGRVELREMVHTAYVAHTKRCIEAAAKKKKK